METPKHIGVIGAGDCSDDIDALALKGGKPVIGLETWKDISGVRYVSSAQEAIQAAASLLGEAT